MKKIEFIKYEAPEMEVLEVEVEKGFASSPFETPEEDDEEEGGNRRNQSEF